MDLDDLDLDDLLDDAERMLQSSHRPAAAAPAASRPISATQATPAKKAVVVSAPSSDVFAEVDDLLELGAPPAATKPTPLSRGGTATMLFARRESLDETVKAQVAKCYPVLLGDPTIPLGLNKGDARKACSALRCTSCDFKVCMFDNVAWDDSCDYLFLRNNVPDFGKLQAKLSPTPGARAYACQCTWRSIHKLTPVRSDELKWVCGRH